jgi:hypothetical protein
MSFTEATAPVLPKAQSISGRQVKIRLGISDHHYMKLCILGKLTPILYPACTPRFDPSEVERIRLELGGAPSVAEGGK